MSLPKIPELKELMEAGVHFGHASAKWHPKMAPYIYVTRDKLHIINLEKTREQLETVLPILEERIAEGKSFILVGTKRQVAGLVQEIGEELGVNYVNERWLGGTMTNFSQIVQSIARMKKMEEQLAEADTTKMIKKERVMMQSEVKRMSMKFSGLRNFTKKPDFLLVIDPAYEHNAIKEALFEGIEIFAVVDTNADPSVVNHVIPANDDGPKSLKLILGLLKETLQSGLEKASKRKETAEAEKAKEEKAKAEEIDVAKPAEEELEDIEEKLEEKEDKDKKEAKSAKPKKEDKDTPEESVTEEGE